MSNRNFIKMFLEIKDSFKIILNKPRSAKTFLALCIDVTSCIISFWIAYYLRLGELLTLSQKGGNAILVSLFICTISIWAAIKGINNLTRNFSDIESAIYASWSAENLLIEEELKKYGFQNNKNNISCDQGNKKLYCSKSYLNTPNPNFTRVKIIISDGKEKQLLLVNKLLNLNEVK